MFFLVDRLKSSDILTSAFLVLSPYSSDGTTYSALFQDGKNVY